MTPDALGLIKGDKLAYGCVARSRQLERLLVQTVNWSAGTDGLNRKSLGGKCKHRDGLGKDMPATTWPFEKNPEGKWRLKSVAQ